MITDMFYESLRHLWHSFNCLQLYLATQCVREGVQLTDLSPRSEFVAVCMPRGRLSPWQLDILLAIWTLICEEDNQMRHRSWFGGGVVGRLASWQGVWDCHQTSFWFVESVQESRDKMGQGPSMFFFVKKKWPKWFPLRYHLEAYVPLEPSFPPQRLRFMLEDSQVPWNIERFGRRIWLFGCGKIKWAAACMILCVPSLKNLECSPS